MKVTWLGEDTDTEAGPSYTDWNGVRFHKGVPVEITGEKAIEKARGNRFFSVSEDVVRHTHTGINDPGKPKETKDGQQENPPWVEGETGKLKTPPDYTPLKKRKKPKAKKPQEPKAEADRDGPAVPDTSGGLDATHTPRSGE